MADTGTLTPTFKPRIGGVKRIDFDWTSDAAGNVTQLINAKLSGFLLCVVTKPDGADVPTTYSVLLEDDKSIDMFLGITVLRSTSVTETIAIQLDSSLPRPVSTDIFTFKITGAGDSKKGLVQLFYN